MKATYNITNNRLFLWPDARLPEDQYKAVKAVGLVWWPRGCFTGIWNPEAEDLIKTYAEIEDDDTPDDVEKRVNRYQTYAENDEKTAEYAKERLLSGAANTARRINQAENTAASKTEEAQYWHNRIAGAISAAEYKDRPDVIARRIKGIEADQRKHKRNLEEAEKLLKVWEVLPCDYERAVKIANYGFMDYDFYRKVENKTITPEEAQAEAINRCNERIERESRWIAHLDRRLEYEKAYLEAAGGSELLAPKPRRVSIAPDDGLKKGMTVTYSVFWGGRCDNFTGQILSLSPKSCRVSVPEEKDINKNYPKGMQVGRRYVKAAQ